MIRLINLILIIFFISSTGYTSHTNDNSSISIPAKDAKKKDLQSKYCTIDVKKIKEPVVETIIEKNENGEEIKKEIQVINEYFVIKSFHAKETKPAPKNLDFSILKNKIKKNTYIGVDKTDIKTLLSFYCVQEKPEEGKSKKFKPIKKNDKTELTKLYNQIAEINGLADMNSLIGEEIFKKGSISLSVEDTKLVWSKAQFIINEENRLAQKRKDEEDKAAEIQKEKDFIARIKPELVEEITKKKLEFDKQIKDYNNDFTKIKIEFENFEKYFKEKNLETEDLLDLVDVSQKEIKDKAIELKKAKREFLSNIIVDAIEDKYNQLSDVKTKDFNSYKKIEKLLKDIEKKSNKKVCFEKGKKSRIHCNPSFPDQWSRIKQDKLGIESLNINIKDLNKDIEDARKDITNNIDTLNKDIRKLEEDLGDQPPWNYIIIGILIFLAVIGFGIYVYFNNRKIKQLQEEADKKVGSLKSDFEGRLKDTSDKIRSAQLKNNQSNNQGNKESSQQLKPKTPEQIIAEKYDEMVSDYNDALDDFSKVATFKQKWSGVALSRKERQEGSKTILISSARVFEKAEIWCLNFDGKFFAFPGSTVKSNMATYMNLDFEKASRDFKGVLSVTTGSNYSTEPAVLRKGGAGYVVERPGKITFPT